MRKTNVHISLRKAMGGSRGEGTDDPPGKSQVLWVSIGNKQLDPPLEKVGPPPLENEMLDPVWNLGK